MTPITATSQILEEAGVPQSANYGTNLFGLPGDASSQSRFARAFFHRAFAQANVPSKSTEQAIIQQQAVINAVYIPFGAVSDDTKGQYDYTIFTSMRVLSERKYLFRTYSNMEWQSIDLKKFAALKKPFRFSTESVKTLAVREITPKEF